MCIEYAHEQAVLREFMQMRYKIIFILFNNSNRLWCTDICRSLGIAAVNCSHKSVSEFVFASTWKVAICKWPVNISGNKFSFAYTCF